LERAVMSVAGALKAARAVGIEVGIDGDDLVLKASAAPPSAVLDLLSRHKAAIVALLRPANDGWSAEDWQVFFEERAGIAEFDGDLPRVEAEARAFACCVVEWLNRSSRRSPPGHCPDFGGGDHAHEPHCWWHVGRKAEAIAALTAMGIAGLPEFPDDFEKNGGA
jgi:hypothetical protein